jgi:hypothetical protein
MYPNLYRSHIARLYRIVLNQTAGWWLTSVQVWCPRRKESKQKAAEDEEKGIGHVQEEGEKDGTETEPTASKRSTS